MKKFNIIVSALFMPLLALAQSVTSPNGNVSVTFSLSEKGQPTYEMSYKGKTVCKPSHLGLELAKDKHASKGMEETDLMDGFKVTNTKTSSFDETWTPVWGETSTIRNNYNEMEVNLNQPASKRNITIRFRVYDYGMGLRYEFPQQESLNYFVIQEEHTQFAMTGAILLTGFLATTTLRSMNIRLLRSQVSALLLPRIASRTRAILLPPFSLTQACRPRFR